ncbi:MAG: hypothetical protein ABJA71_08535 [Ginsengibacter sp.]
MDQSNDGYKSFERSITITCTVNGKTVHATILGKDESSNQHAYKVAFSDGFTAMFVNTRTGWQAEKKGGEPYVEAIRTRLDNFLRNSLKSRFKPPK